MEIEREYPQRTTVRLEFDPSTTRFALSQRVVVRITIGGLVFVPIMVLAAYFEQWFGFWFSLFCSGFVTLWQVVAYGFGGASMERQLNVTRFYSPVYLAFIGVVWAALITLVALAFYLKARGA